METLFHKIVKLCPELTDLDFRPASGTILLLKIGDGEEHIAEWNHPTLPKPTAEQLA